MATLLFAAAVLIATRAPAASGEARVPDGDALALRQLTEQRFQASATNDRSFYERLLAPHFPPFTKQAYLDAEFPPQRAPRAKATITGLEATANGDSGTVGYEVVESYPLGDLSFVVRSRRLDSYPQARTVFERDASGKVVAQTYRAQGNQVRATKIR